MAKKLTVFFAALAFASVTSVGFACNTSCKGKKDKDSGDTGLTSASFFEVASKGCGNGGCGNKDKDNP